MEQIALSGVEPGQRCRVEEIGLSGPLARRLMDLGLVEGTEAVCRLRGPWGDPMAFEVRGTVIALRASDAGQIFGRVER